MRIEPIENGVRIVPETEFETDYLASLFIGSKDREVIVKSGSSIADLISIDVRVKDVS